MNKASSSRDLESASDLIRSEENSEEDDSESNLLEALSANASLKRKVSEEVNAEIKREELLEFVNGNSKEVQYSDQISAIEFHQIV